MMELIDCTVGGLTTANAVKYPDKIAVEFQSISYTWAEVDRLTDALAFYFARDGIRKGDHVGIYSVNSIHFVLAFIALAKIGALSVLINFNNKYEELLEVIRYAKVTYLCYGDGFKETDFRKMVPDLRKEEGLSDLGLFDIGPLPDGKWFRAADIPADASDLRIVNEMKKEVRTEDFLCMIFTSGTTARPKGIRLTHFQTLNVAREAGAVMGWGPDDRICLCLSLFHSFGLSTGLLADLVNGCTLDLLPNFRSVSMLTAIEEHRCTVLCGVPSMFLAMMNNPRFGEFDISSLRSGIIAGSGVRANDYIRIRAAFGYRNLAQSFGQTETSPSITFTDENDPLALLTVSVGKPIPNVELRITDPETGKVLPQPQQGEVEVRGFNVMTEGYYEMPEENEKVFAGDGWLRTGDLGYLDLNGNLYIIGRQKDIIIRGGENISPREIEEAILLDPAVKDVCVFGVPDPVMQEEVAACLVMKDSFSEENMRALLKKHLADYKIPRYFRVMQEFPLRSNGKVDKEELRRMFGRLA